MRRRGTEVIEGGSDRVDADGATRDSGMDQKWGGWGQSNEPQMMGAR